MKRKYLGDSYDAVKRLWQQVLSDRAPLKAEPRFIPAELREDFTRLTGIPMLMGGDADSFSILNDPDTGIRLPEEQNQLESRTHVSIARILVQLKEQKPYCVITFDQSHYRQKALSHGEQRQAKLDALTRNGAFGFYYVSHAPFLFAFQSNEVRQELRKRLVRTGIPEWRIQL